MFILRVYPTGSCILTARDEQHSIGVTELCHDKRLKALVDTIIERDRELRVLKQRTSICDYNMMPPLAFCTSCIGCVSWHPRGCEREDRGYR
jgi:hypothetical protein